MGDMGTNFRDDEQSVTVGMVCGILVARGIPAFPVIDDAGDYTPRIRIRVDVGHPQPIDVVLEVV